MLRVQDLACFVPCIALDADMLFLVSAAAIHLSLGVTDLSALITTGTTVAFISHIFSKLFRQPLVFLKLPVFLFPDAAIAQS